MEVISGRNIGQIHSSRATQSAYFTDICVLVLERMCYVFIYINSMVMLHKSTLQ